MAISANSNNRSPSPNLSRPNSNPRNSETKSPMRRSFSGNPFPRPSSIHTNPRSFVPATPANSPADFSRRKSIEKEEKENEKDQIFKPTKVRSPAVAKSAKNFMTPTISAASKINPSPKKKVLTEKNDPVRTSFLFSDGKGPFGSMSLADFTENFDSKSDMGLNQRKVQDLKDSEITDHEHNEAFLETPFNSNSSQKGPSFNAQALPSNALDFKESSDKKPMDESNNNKPFVSSISPNIAPLDADPSLPPYDPKTNYLSPRPQFLHYRPNPRLEIFFQKELGNGGKRLEESFLSEGFSDTEVTEESESENSSVEVLNEELEPSVQVINEELKPEISEPKPNTTTFDTHISLETAEDKREIKPRLFSRTKAISLLMFVLIACLSVSVTDSPRFDLPVYENLNLSDSKFYESSINGFARHLKQWSAYSTSYFSQLISNFSTVEKLGSLQFTNLTYLPEDPFTDEKGFDNMEPVPEDEVEIEQIDQKSEKGDGGEKVTEEEVIIEEDTEIDHLDTAQKREQGEITLPISDNLQNSTVLDDQSALISEDPENSPEIAVTWVIGDNHLISDSKIEATTKEANLENTLEMGALISEVQSFNQVDPDISSEKAANEGSKGENHLISDSKIEATTAVPTFENTFELGTSIPEVQSSNLVDSSLNLPEDKSSLIPVISLLALAVMAASVFIYLKNKKANTQNSLILIDPLLTKKLMIPNPPSQICPPEVDLVGESCPSEMTSFDKSFSYSKREEWGTYEAHHSQEKRRRRRISKRESLASSSEFSMGGSPSYGSFTTYESLPNKHGYGDDEVVTPVRRSSRIKNQVTSS